MYTSYVWFWLTMFDVINKLHKSTYDNYNIIGIKETLINN
jgi:hypothetical protein